MKSHWLLIHFLYYCIYWTLDASVFPRCSLSHNHQGIPRPRVQSLEGSFLPSLLISHGAELRPGATRNGQELLVPRTYSCMFLSSIVSGPSGAWCSIMRCQLLLYCIHVRTAGFWLITQNLWIFRRATQLFVSCIRHLSSINASFGSCQATLPCPSILALPFLLVGISFISRDIKIETWRQALHRSVRCF